MIKIFFISVISLFINLFANEVKVIAVKANCSPSKICNFDVTYSCVIVPRNEIRKTEINISLVTLINGWNNYSNFRNQHHHLSTSKIQYSQTHILWSIFFSSQRYIHHRPPLKQIITATNIRNKLIPLMFSINAYCFSINNRLKELSL